MSRFGATLGALSDRLSLPQPARARVLMEVAGDLEALYAELVERGLSSGEAVEVAVERVDLSDEALRGLVRVHGGWLRRWTDRVGERAARRWETVLLAGLVLAGVGLSGSVVGALPMARAAGVSLVPVSLVAAVALGLGIWKAHVLWIRRDHRLRGLYRGLGGMLGAVVLQPFLAFGAIWVTGWRTSRAVRLSPETAGAMTFDWLFGALALLVMGLGLALLGGLLWFLLVGRVASIERAEAAMVLPDGLR